MRRESVQYWFWKQMTGMCALWPSAFILGATHVTMLS